MKRISCLLSLNTKASVLWQQCESRLARSDEVVIKLTTCYSCAEWCELAFFVFLRDRSTIVVAKGHTDPKFLVYLVVLCFERWCPKQNTVARLKSKYFSLPPKKIKKI